MADGMAMKMADGMEIGECRWQIEMADGMAIEDENGNGFKLSVKFRMQKSLFLLFLFYGKILVAK